MRTVVVIPTYNEVDNIEPLLTAVRAAAPEADILVVDDSSPDGTAEAAEKVGAELGHIRVLRRPGKDGLGNAYREGFTRVLGEGYDIVVQMDADLSHEPAVVPQLIAKIESGADVAIGSRYVPGGSTPGWPVHRKLLSRWGNRYTGWILRLRMHDATAGFRAYRADALRAIRYDTTDSSGYAFLTELSHRISRGPCEVVEVPIAFRDRRYGSSKMSARIIGESMLRITLWGARQRLRPPREQAS